jgi:hypothetical protein
MKRLTLIALLLSLFAIVPPAHAQACTPPQDAQIVAMNVTDQWVAWAIGSSVTWCGNGITVSTYEGTYIDTLYWDAYWLPYNLYFGYSVDGYLFQMNVSTGTGYLISPHGQPPGDEGGAHADESPVMTTDAPAIEPHVAYVPVVRRPPVKPLAIFRFDVVRLWE